MTANDENDRRLSNGFIAEPAVSCTDYGFNIDDKTSDRTTPSSSPTLRPAFVSPPGQSPAGGGRDVAPSVVEAVASPPTVSTRSSGASSAETRLDGGGGGDKDAGNGAGEYDDTTDGSMFDSSSGSDVDSIGPVRKQSAASSATTVSESGTSSPAASPSLSPTPSLGVEEQSRQSQPRGDAAGESTKGNRPGGRREVGRGTVFVATTTAKAVSDTIVTTRAKKASHAVAGSCKKPLGVGIGGKREPVASVPENTMAKTITTPRKQLRQQQQQRQMNYTAPCRRQQPSAWAMKPSERQPPLKRATGTSQRKIPSSTLANGVGKAAKTAQTAKTAKTAKTVKTTPVGGPTEKIKPRPLAPRPNGAASGRKSGGGGGRQVAGSDDAGDGSAGGRSTSSTDKRLTPRVSTSRTMAWERSLRTEPSEAPSKSTWDNSPSGSKKKNKKGSRQTTRKGKKGGGNRGEGSGHGKVIHDDVHGKGNRDGVGGERGVLEDGRPSIGTWETIKTHLKILMEHTGKDEEELQWLTVAGDGGGIAKSDNEREMAETEYHRLLFEESMQELAMKVLNDRRLEGALKGVSSLGDELESVTELLEELAQQGKTQDGVNVPAVTAEAASTSQADDVATMVTATTAGATTEAETRLEHLLENITTEQEKLKALGSVLKDEYKRISGRGKGSFDTVLGIVAAVSSARELIAPSRAKTGLRCIKETTDNLAKELKKTRSESQAALKQMEKWRARHEDLPEFGQQMADKERKWLAREGPANEQALQRMRALISVGVSSVTVAELKLRAVERGSLYPHELALRLKENRLLRWIVMHPDDIARTNFLKGCHAHFFTNLDQYDMVEMRAVLACLPAKFEADGDGKKATWRAAFFQRVQSLVAQERGDEVSGGWDPAASARRTVRLPQLTAEQTRRKEYFYPTSTEMQEKEKKIMQRQERLQKRKVELAEVKEVLLPEAQAEYSNVLEDTRHPANKEAFKPEDLRRARDEAKAEVERLRKEASRLESEVSSAQRVLRESPYTVESLRAEAEAIRQLLTERTRKLRVPTEEQQEEIKTSAAEPASALAVAATTDVASLAEGEKNGPDVEVTEGSEIEGGFDPTPEIKSRFADKSTSLRFVTPEEEKRKRQEEMAAVFAGRNAATAAEATELHGGGISEDGVSIPDGRGAAEGQPSAVEVADVGPTRGLTKALSSLLERKLNPSCFARAPPPGSTAICSGSRAGAKVRAAGSSARQQQQQRASKKKATTVPTPRFEPKSKLFRSMLSSSGATGATGRSACPPPPPPPPPPLPSMAGGLLAEIRMKGCGRGMVPPPPPPPLSMPMPLPHAPALALPQRSLFATASKPSTSAATGQGAAAGMFAELKAKTAAKQALRRAAVAETKAKSTA